ncbi:general odorant-binding protein 56a-like [Phymastichus coffea]|uniref:general odorant-binding protein 56a-like n=1 Tax=Phymastichus coffea TaxID=108790 RepID=UPI00273C0B32|nr:general odorant-binding protein 56a-like [Phymastichus coffea]
MKFFILYLLIGIISVSSHSAEDESKPKGEVKKLPTEVEECAQQEGLKNIHDVEETIKNKDYNNLTREMRCFTACVFKKQGLIGPDGTAHKNFQRPEIARHCKDLSGKDECEIAYKIVVCMNRPEFFDD